MTKLEAIKIFGNQKNISEALKITKGAVSQWPDILDSRISDELVGAAIRLKKPLPVNLVMVAS